MCDADPVNVALYMCEFIQNSAKSTALQLFNVTQVIQRISKLYFFTGVLQMLLRLYCSTKFTLKT